MPRIICPLCKHVLNQTTVDGDCKIWSCKCSDYPSFQNIIYLKRDKLQSKAVRLIRLGHNKNVLRVLLNLHPRLFLPVTLLLSNGPFNTFSKWFCKKNIWELIEFRTLIKTLGLFTYSKSWVQYLLRRESDLSFKLSRYATTTIKNNDNVLDIGIGVGQLLPTTLGMANNIQLFGVENSMLSLLIALRFFSKQDTTLICCNVEKGMPFPNNYFNNVIVCDALDDMRNKIKFLSNLGKIINTHGILSIIHIINSDKPTFQNIKGIQYNKVYNILNKIGFSKINIFKNNELNNQRLRGTRLLPKSQFISKSLKQADAYSIVAQK